MRGILEMEKNKLEVELEQLRKWYKEESHKIWNIPAQGLDGPRQGMRNKLDKQFLEKRAEILNKYAVVN